MDTIGLVISNDYKNEADTYVSIAPSFNSLRKGDYVIIEDMSSNERILTVIQHCINVRKGSNDWDFIISLVGKMPTTRVKSKLYEYECTYMEGDDEKSDKS